ncbi:Signal transduction histidine kinase [Chitinophaga sp. CF118]|uniref:sensor histidine kinase n=1 Tax=Chitinophaga sp. CF118 TaxID=1884367 RepID=UPI0008EC0D5D|nr:HAMP domain-containing sensor histidine kinase [Chitinophaga sp. CF118]SFD12468.1 Signal transduction histidine kinase [Chitinophaga sp. CF118]
MYAQQKIIQALQSQLPLTHDTSHIDILNKLAAQYLHRQLDTCFLYLSAACEGARQAGYKKGEAQSYRTLGSYYTYRDNSYLSFRFYLDALKIYEALGDSIGICLLNMDLGTYYQFGGKHKEATQYIQKAVGIGRRLHNDSLYAIVLAKYYFIYHSDSQYKADAAKALAVSRSLAVKYGDERMVLYTSILQTDELLDKGDTAAAENKLDTLIAEAIRQGYSYHAMYGYSQIAVYKCLQHRPDSLYYQQQLIKTALASGYREVVLPEALGMYAYYSAYGPVDSATHYSGVLADITEKQEQSKTQGELDYIDYYMQEKQLRELQLRHDYQQQWLDRKAIGSRDRYIIIIALLILLLLTVLLLVDVNRSHRRSARNTKRLGEKNREISEKNVLLRTHDDFKNKLISLIAHDFRAPLIHITDITALLKDQLLTLDEVEKLFRRLESNSQHTLHIFDNILRWIRSQLTGFVYAPSPCQPAEMIAEALLALKENCEEKSIKINVQLSDDILVLADREMLQFIHRNLLHNAVKFSPACGTISVYAVVEGEKVTVFFKDEGKGIQPEILSHLFEYQDMDKDKRGAGLALIICKDFIDKMNGTIKAVNNPDKGSTLSYTLPAVK